MKDVTLTIAEEVWLTVAEVATIMRVSKMTVYRLVHSGELEAIRMSARTIRVPEQGVWRYLAERGNLLGSLVVITKPA